MNNPSEDSELIAFFDYIRWQETLNPILSVIFHVENERKCSWAQGLIRKKKGVRAGVPDIIVPIPKGPFHGLFIELKLPGRKPTVTQQEYMIKLYTLGYCVKIAYSAEQAISILKEYLELEAASTT